MWIYEYTCWPNFTWDTSALAGKLGDARFRLGRLLGRMEGIGFELQQEAHWMTLTNDVVHTSAIEGEILNRAEVRSSVARHLGIDMDDRIAVSRNVDAIVEIMLDATKNFSEPLTVERLFNWHAALFPTGRSGLRRITTGAWRLPKDGPMQVVSGSIGRETVHFEAPSAERIDAEMHQFLDWMSSESSIDPLLRAGIAHFWFITIHPFEDGNGRIARAIGDMVLAQLDGMQQRFYSISSQIAFERQDYYLQLEKQQRGSPDITGWLSWFLDCLVRAIERAETVLGKVKFKAALWSKVQAYSLNERQRLILNRMLEDGFEGFMHTSKYAKLAKCSNDTALRDIQELKEKGILTANAGGGRSTSYRITGWQEI